MPDVKDMDLMREYADRDSEPAFAELVRRYINLVYSVALRYAGNSHDAQDVTQAVFIILAQKAARLRHRPTLTGWLYETTRFTAMRFLRTKTRRQFREQEAYMQSTLNESDTDGAWKQLAPLLEEAMTRLNEKERALLALRFFENKSGAETAALLGIEEWAGRKRVERAVEKLRTFFAWRGIRVSAGVLTGAISAHSVQAAPVALAKTVTALAVAKGAAASGSTLTLIKGALKIMAWTKAKTAIVVGVAAILAVGTTPIVIHHYRNAPIFSRTQELSSNEDAQYAKLTGTTPEQAAKAFFEACSQEDWTEAAKFWQPSTRYPGPLGDKFQSYFRGMQVVSLGKPFWGWFSARGKYGGVWVPYEIRLKNGEVRKGQLQIQCDNPDKRWFVEGGL
jgi:RNA polymerase sigma factor (sigma-70 family)